MYHAEILRDRPTHILAVFDRKRLIDNRHFDRIAVGNQPIAWVLLDAEAFRNKESQESWIDLLIRVKTFKKWSVDIPVNLNFGTETEVLFSYPLPRPLSITCTDDSSDTYKISISSSTYDRLNAINDWVVKTAPATECK